jgi:peptidyl-prolyl cis-trans isomerase C
MNMQLKWLVLPAVLMTGLMACQERIIIDRQAPFGSKVVRLGDVEVAAVDGTSIYLSDVEQMARAKGELTGAQNIDPDTALFKSTLRELIDQRVLALAAITEALDQSQAAKRRRAAVLEQLYGRLVIENELKLNVTDDEIRRLYDAQKTLNDRGPERRARLILVATQEEANAVLERLEGGEDFGVLAGVLSRDEATRNKNGDLGYFSRDMLADAVAKAAFETPVKSLAPVFETDDGFHILEVLDQRRAPQRSFEAMESELREFLTFETINNKIQSLRQASDIRLNVASTLDSQPFREGAGSMPPPVKNDDIQTPNSHTPDTPSSDIESLDGED